ncbi:BrnT family toxin [Azospirillum sp.]|uniref:BrnT family toxin n=1 Tax=Azospirillum sp. TaxID=34012 RepID=UPI002D259881|nr:BrnT family toxin [Azospirillum sp.]HYF88971.1 BrnT family toxin [Azospirillum sp.]
MKIVYDPPKRASNLDKHGLDFADLEDGAFFEDAVVIPSRDGRFKAVGWLGAIMVVVVVFKPLGTQALSVISMRPANRKERTLLP